MTDIYLLRHPETVWNVEGRFQGRKEGPITKKGEEEASNFVKNLQLKRIDIIYYAESNRTKYMAWKIKKRYKDAVLLMDPRLNERDFGENEGKLYAEVYDSSDNFVDYELRFKRKPPKGESHEEVSNRVNEFINDVLCLDEEKVVLCITSGSVIRNILRINKNLSLEEMYKMDIPNLYFVKL
ncbi:MAG: phosphoglycerate mutase family protein [Patescibacteria group bacterium]|nr:phosphoglycerate mutase family protein [Patescibacteria group bacterium]